MDNSVTLDAAKNKIILSLQDIDSLDVFKEIGKSIESIKAEKGSKRQKKQKALTELDRAFKEYKMIDEGKMEGIPFDDIIREVEAEYNER